MLTMFRILFAPCNESVIFFSILQAEYLQFRLHFNSAKSEIVFFNWRTDLLNSVKLENSSIQPVHHLVYSSLPTGSFIHHTRNLLIEHLTHRISASYASIISCKFRFNRHLLASLFNAIALPHILYISLFWKLLTNTDPTKISPLFFRFAKYLPRLPPWQTNTKIIPQFKIADPNIAVTRVIDKHNKKVNMTALGCYSVSFQ